mmetsp:Transcript_21919/g.35487  ORF Transcript_21919/g.35487 Transcript_21919/m.35487 type:complete len:97 (+) Transcript_21919:577-867(+)
MTSSQCCLYIIASHVSSSQCCFISLSRTSNSSTLHWAGFFFLCFFFNYTAAPVFLTIIGRRNDTSANHYKVHIDKLNMMVFGWCSRGPSSSGCDEA